MVCGGHLQHGAGVLLAGGEGWEEQDQAGDEEALVRPSEEDSHTFSINFNSGEVFKVRAAQARERQMC